MDRLSRWIDPLGQAETFSYDANGNLMSATDRKHQTSTFTYDALDRRTQAEYADGAVASFTFDTAGRLTQADDTADPHRPITLSYDPLDRLLTETTSLGTVSYQYDALGPRTSMTVSGQAPVTYTYDANSRLRTITQAPLNPADIQYDPLGRRTLLTLPNGVSTEYQYDAASRLTALIYRNALGPFGDLTYSYDANGNRTGVGGSWARSLLPEPIPSATYDAANRQLAFGGKTMAFDDNGNLVNIFSEGNTTSYTWDGRDRLIAYGLSAGTRIFSYDAIDRRARTTRDGQLVALRYDGLDIATEVASASAASYVRALAIDEVFAKSDTEGTLFYLADALGSTVALSDVSGDITSSLVYGPFGETRIEGHPAGNPFRYSGRENDEAGLYYYRARYYRSDLARFVSQDPIGLAAGDTNPYTYAFNNPMVFGDPTGLAVAHFPQNPVTELGDSALRFWADLTVDPNASWYVRDSAYVLGFFAALAGRKTIDTTIFVLSMARGGAGRIRPDPKASGAHSVFKRDPQTGSITHYETYRPQTNPQNPNPWELVKRYDAIGRARYNKATDTWVPTPHVNDPTVPGGVRPAMPHEIPR